MKASSMRCVSINDIEFRVRLVQGNGEWRVGNEISFHFSLSFLCLDKFYKNRNEIKSNSDRQQTLISK